jgi:hypothetical protein
MIGAEGKLFQPLAFTKTFSLAAAVLLVGILLTDNWLPLGPAKGFLRNFAFVAILIGGLLTFFKCSRSTSTNQFCGGVSITKYSFFACQR